MYQADDILNIVTKALETVSPKKEDIIRARDTSLRQATHVVYAPNEEDSHGTWATEEVIREGCHSFNTHCRKANLFHRAETNLIEIVESYILPIDAKLGDRDIKRGTW